MMDRTMFLPPGEGSGLEAPGLQVTVKVRQEQVNGAYSLLEYLLAPHLKGPAQHYHSRSDETFYVLEEKYDDLHV